MFIVIGSLDLSTSLDLFVQEAFENGQFFGHFSTVGSDEPLYEGLQGMFTELHDTYATLDSPPKLYQTTNQRLLGYYGVMRNVTDGK